MNASRKLWIILYLIEIFLLASGFAADRVAFVIGNDTYPEAPLDNAIRDASAIRNMLIEELDFLDSDVVYAQDTDEVTFLEKFEEFKAKAANAKIVLLYYAGHGMESLDGKENFIIPIDADIGVIARSEAALKSSGISLMTLTTDLANGSNGAKIVLMDACRQRPSSRGIFRSGGGLATYSDDRIPADTLMILAAAPERLASDGEKHGPFTAALLDVLPRKSENLMASFFAVSDRVQQITNKTQIPWLKFDGSGRIFRQNTFLPPGSEGKNPEGEKALSMKMKEEKFTAADLQIPHRWVDGGGRKIDALFQMIKGTGFESIVVLKTANGTLGEVLLTELSDESRKLARKLEVVRNEFSIAHESALSPNLNSNKPTSPQTEAVSERGLLSPQLNNTKWSWGPVSDGRIRYFFSDQTEMASWASTDPRKYENIDDHSIKIFYTIGAKKHEVLIEFDENFRSFNGRSTFSGSVEGTFLGPIQPGDAVLGR